MTKKLREGLNAMTRIWRETLSRGPFPAPDTCLWIPALLQLCRLLYCIMHISLIDLLTLSPPPFSTPLSVSPPSLPPLWLCLCVRTLWPSQRVLGSHLVCSGLNYCTLILSYTPLDFPAKFRNFSRIGKHCRTKTICQIWLSPSLKYLTLCFMNSK